MAQLKGIAINNFRVFKEHTQFEFAPITILTGPNSSGKSSLFKALLMLADSAKKYQLTELDFTGESHYLGNFEDVLNSETGSDTLTFDLDFSGEKDILFGMLEEGFTLRLEYDKMGLKSFYLLVNKWIEQEYELMSETMLYYYNFDSEQEKTTTYLNLNQIIAQLQNKYLIDGDNLDEGDQSFKELKSVVKDKILLDYLSSFDTKSVRNFIRNIMFVLYELNTSYGNPPIKSLKLDYSYPVYQKYEYGDDGYIDDIYLNKISDMFLESYKDLYKDYFTIIGELEIENEIASQLFKDFCNKKLNPEFAKFNEFLLSTIVKELGNLAYTEAIRANTRRIYAYQSQGTNINQLLLNFKRVVEKSEENAKAVRIHFLRQWIKKMNIGEDIKIKNISGAANEVVILKNNREINLADLGYGYTQFLSIPLKFITETKLNQLLTNHAGKLLTPYNWYIYRSAPLISMKTIKKAAKMLGLDPENFEITGVEKKESEKKSEEFIKVEKYTQDTFDFEVSIKESLGKYHFPEVNGPLFLLEEPETNLHPKLQSMLADFFVEACRTFEMTLVAETHSEYLVRKLQYLVSKGEIRPQDVAIYYFYPPGEVPEGRKQVERINIQPDGRLDNEFGTGFFDEATNWQIELMKLKNELHSKTKWN